MLSQTDPESGVVTIAPAVVVAGTGGGDAPAPANQSDIPMTEDPGGDYGGDGDDGDDDESSPPKYMESKESLEIAQIAIIIIVMVHLGFLVYYFGYVFSLLKFQQEFTGWVMNPPPGKWINRTGDWEWWFMAILMANLLPPYLSI